MTPSYAIVRNLQLSPPLPKNARGDREGLEITEFRGGIPGRSSAVEGGAEHLEEILVQVAPRTT